MHAVGTKGKTKQTLLQRMSLPLPWRRMLALNATKMAIAVLCDLCR